MRRPRRQKGASRNCPHCGQKWPPGCRSRRHGFILLRLSATVQPSKFVHFRRSYRGWAVAFRISRCGTRGHTRGDRPVQVQRSNLLIPTSLRFHAIIYPVPNLAQGGQMVQSSAPSQIRALNIPPILAECYAHYPDDIKNGCFCITVTSKLGGSDCKFFPSFFRPFH